MSMGKLKDEKVVILRGSLGTHMREETEYRPKALVEIGGRSILWHLMRVYHEFGYYKFVLCLGYKKKIATLSGFHARLRYVVARADGNGIVNYWQVLLANLYYETYRLARALSAERGNRTGGRQVSRVFVGSG